MEQKWAFPEIPGRLAPPGAVDFEFMRTLVQVFQLEECLEDPVIALRDRVLQKMKKSAFSDGITFTSPCFPLMLQDVLCPGCGVASHVDVTSHPTRGPGLWVCMQCRRLYDKEVMQARLVGLLENVVQAWQSQEVACKKCKTLRTAHLQQFCECFGKFELRFAPKDFNLVMRILRSLVIPHDLQWLGEMLDLQEQLL